MSAPKHTGVVHVQGARLPLGQGRFSRQFPADCCVQQIVAACLPAALRPFARVSIEGAPVASEHWAQVRVRAGRSVTVHVVPGVQISWGAIAVEVGRAFATAVVGYGISELFAEDLDTTPSSTSHRLEGGANQLRPYGSVPKVFGKIRFAPPLANAWIHYTKDGKQWLQGLLCWGAGDLDISDVRLDQTPLSTFEDKLSITTEYVPAGSAATGFPNAIRAVAIGADLNEPGAVTRRIGHVAVNVRVNLVFPRGLYRQRSSGDREAITLTLRFQMSREGTQGDTQTRTLTATPGEAPFYTSVALAAPPGEGVVDLTITRVSSAGSIKFISDLSIASVTATLKEKPLTIAATLSAVKVQATGQLSGGLPVISGVVQAKLPAWDGSAWTPATTRNPAAAFREVLLGSANARPMPSNRLAAQTLQEWFTWCETQKWTYDAVIHQRRSVEEVLTEIAAAGRARPSWVDGKRAVIIDRPQTARAQIFTPRNIRSFSGQRRFADPAPHALRLPYRDEEADYTISELRVYRPGYTSKNATLVEERRLPGITSATALRRHAAYQLAAQSHRREIYEIEVDWEHLVATRGDRVGIMHDTLHKAAHAARAIEVEAKGAATEVRLDTPAPSFKSGLRYRAIVRGTELSSTLNVVAPAARPGWLRVAGSVSEGDLLLIGLAGSEVLDCILQDIEPGADASARLRLIPYGGSPVLAPLISDYTAKRITSGNFVEAVPFGGTNIPIAPPADPIGETNREYIYTRTKANARPVAPDATSNTNQYVPAGWTDNAIGVDSIWRHEWRSERALRDGAWQPWSVPALLASHTGPEMPDAVTVSPTARIVFWYGDAYGPFGSPIFITGSSPDPPTATGKFTGPVSSTVTITGQIRNLRSSRDVSYTREVSGGAVTFQEYRTRSSSTSDRLDIVARQTATGAEWRIIITS